eukprot:g118.t1
MNGSGSTPRKRKGSLYIRELDASEKEDLERYRLEHAATKLQAHVRGRLVRKEKRVSRLYVRNLDAWEQTELHKIRVNTAATKVEAMVRGNIVRKNMVTPTRTRKSALSPKSLQEFNDRMQEKDASTLKESITKIQARARGCFIRCEMNEEKEDLRRLEKEKEVGFNEEKWPTQAVRSPRPHSSPLHGFTLAKAERKESMKLSQIHKTLVYKASKRQVKKLKNRIDNLQEEYMESKNENARTIARLRQAEDAAKSANSNLLKQRKLMANVQSEMAKYKTESKHLSLEITKHKEMSDRVSSEAEKIRRENSQLKKQIESLKSGNETTAEIMKILKSEIKSNKSIIDNLKTENTALKKKSKSDVEKLKKLEGTSKKMKDKENEIRQLKSTIKSMREKYINQLQENLLESKLEESKAKEALQNELNQLFRECKAKDESIVQLQSQFEDHKAEILKFHSSEIEEYERLLKENMEKREKILQESRNYSIKVIEKDEELKKIHASHRGKEEEISSLHAKLEDQKERALQNNREKDEKIATLYAKIKDHLESHNEKDEKIASLHNHLEKTEKSHKVKDETIGSLGSKITIYKDELSKKKVALQKKKDELVHVTKAHKRKNEEIAMLKLEISKTKLNTEATNKKLEEFRSSSSSLSVENKKLKKQLENIIRRDVANNEKIIAQLNLSIKEAKEGKEKMVQVVKEKDAELKILQKEMKGLKKSNDEMQEEILNSKREAAILQQELKITKETSKSHLEQFHSELEKQKLQTKTARSEGKKYESMVVKLEASISKSKSKIEAIHLNLENTKQDLKRTNAKLKKRVNELGVARSSLKDMKSLLNETKSNVEEQKRENQHAYMALETQKSLTAEAESTVKEQKIEIDALHSKIKKQKGVIEEQNNEIVASHTAIEEQEALVEESRTKIGEQKSEIDSLHSQFHEQKLLFAKSRSEMESRMKIEVETAHAKIKKQKKEIKVAHLDSNTCKKELAKVKKQLKDNAVEAEELRSALLKQEALVMKCQSTIDEQKNKIEAAHLDSSTCKKELAKVKTQLKDNAVEAEKLRSALLKQEALVMECQSTIDEQKTEIEAAHSDLKVYATKMRDFKAKANEANSELKEEKSFIEKSQLVIKKQISEIEAARLEIQKYKQELMKVNAEMKKRGIEKLSPTSLKRVNRKITLYNTTPVNRGLTSFQATFRGQSLRQKSKSALVESHCEKVKAMRQEHDTLKEKLNHSHNMYTRLVQKLSSSSEDVLQKQKEIMMLRHTVATLKEDLSSVNSSLEFFKGKVAEVKLDLKNQKKKESEDEDDSVDAMPLHLMPLGMSMLNASMKLDNKNLSQDLTQHIINSEKKKFQKTSNENVELKKTIESLKEELKESKRRVDRHCSELKSEEAKRRASEETLNKTISFLKSENEAESERLQSVIEKNMSDLKEKYERTLSEKLRELEIEEKANDNDSRKIMLGIQKVASKTLSNIRSSPAEKMRWVPPIAPPSGGEKVLETELKICREQIRAFEVSQEGLMKVNNNLMHANKSMSLQLKELREDIRYENDDIALENSYRKIDTLQNCLEKVEIESQEDKKKLAFVTSKLLEAESKLRNLQSIEKGESFQLRKTEKLIDELTNDKTVVEKFEKRLKRLRIARIFSDRASEAQKQVLTAKVKSLEEEIVIANNIITDLQNRKTDCEANEILAKLKLECVEKKLAQSLEKKNTRWNRYHRVTKTEALQDREAKYVAWRRSLEEKALVELDQKFDSEKEITVEALKTLLRKFADKLHERDKLLASVYLHAEKLEKKVKATSAFANAQTKEVEKYKGKVHGLAKSWRQMKMTYAALAQEKGRIEWTKNKKKGKKKKKKKKKENLCEKKI